MNGDDFSRSEVGMMLTGLVAAGLAVWRAFFTTKRGLRTDRVEEAEAQARENLISTLQRTIHQQDERINLLTQRVDALAEERNAARIVAGRLEIQVQHLTGTVASLNLELSKMEGLVESANETIRALQERLAEASRD